MPTEKDYQRCDRCGIAYACHFDGKGGTCGDFAECPHIRKRLIGRLGNDRDFIDEDGEIWRVAMDVDQVPTGWLHIGPTRVP